MQNEHNRSLGRRNFLMAAGTAVVSLPLLKRLPFVRRRADEPFTLEAGAAPMRARSDAVRLDFINNHIVPAKPYPVAKMFHSSTMLPTDKKIANQVLSRGSFVFTGNRLVNSSVNAPNFLDAPFTAVLEGQDIKLVVSIPKRIEIKITRNPANNSLTLEPVSKLQVNFLNLPTVGGVSIPISKSQVIDKLSVSTDAIVLDTHGGSVSNKRFRLVLNLNKAAGDLRTPFRSLVRSSINYLARYLLAPALLLGAVLACNGDHPDETCGFPPPGKICYDRVEPKNLIVDFSWHVSSCGCNSDPSARNVVTTRKYADLPITMPGSTPQRIDACVKTPDPSNPAKFRTQDLPDNITTSCPNCGKTFDSTRCFFPDASASNPNIITFLRVP